LTLWGGIDNSEVLPKGGPVGVKAEVERRIEQMGRGGGYVLNAVHNIQPDVPPENIVAMYEHGRTYKPSFYG
jgi:uroporphyrinogen decarboxylase